MNMGWASRKKKVREEDGALRRIVTQVELSDSLTEWAERISAPRAAEMTDLRRKIVNSGSALIASKSFQNLARLGADLGAKYLQHDMSLGTLNDDLSFPNEFIVFSADSAANFLVITSWNVNEGRAHVRQTYPAAIVLEVSHGLVNTSGIRPIRNQPDRIAASIASVWSRGKVIARAVVPIGTKADFARAGIAEGNDWCPINEEAANA
jgi:hypothetical protein